MKLQINADLSEFQRKLDWVSTCLKAGDTCERLDPLLLGRLKNSVAGFGGEEVAKLGAVAAGDAGELTIQVEAGALMLDVIAALRALGFEFHEELS